MPAADTSSALRPRQHAQAAHTPSLHARCRRGQADDRAGHARGRSPGHRPGDTTGNGPAPADASGRRARPPLLALALPAAVTIWSGWVGMMTGFGIVHPLPGIWGSLRLNTAVTLPVGVETYAAYALRAWLSASTAIAARTRRFARRSAVGSLLLGMAGQGGCHLLAQARVTRAPWAVTTAVSCLPVLVLGMGAALAHLLRSDAHAVATTDRIPRAGQATRQDRAPGKPRTDRLREAEEAARRLAATGRRVSRRALRAAGVRGSNADLGALARALAERHAQAAPVATQPRCAGLAALELSTRSRDRPD